MSNIARSTNLSFNNKCSIALTQKMMQMISMHFRLSLDLSCIMLMNDINVIFGMLVIIEKLSEE